MNSHLDQESLTGYIYRTLDDAERESIDEHLLHCPTCRGRLAEGERRQRQISNELSAAVNIAAIPKQMSFAKIAPRLRPRRILRIPWRGLAFSPSLAFTLIGLTLALAGLWQVIGHGTAATTPHIGAFPPLACFFFMLASVEEYDKAAFSVRPRFVVIVLATVILWLGTAIIGVFNILVLRDLAIAAAVALGGGAAEALPAVMMAMYFGGVTLYILAVIGGAEYHLKNMGQPRSWKLFSITLLGQLFILILPYWVY